MKISVDELQRALQQNEKITLLDVRTHEEFEAANLGGVHIPLDELEEKYTQLDKNDDIVVLCRSGRRSQTATEFLQEKGYPKVRNITGGILAWQQLTQKS